MHNLNHGGSGELQGHTPTRSPGGAGDARRTPSHGDVRIAPTRREPTRCSDIKVLQIRTFRGFMASLSGHSFITPTVERLEGGSHGPHSGESTLADAPRKRRGTQPDRAPSR